MGYFTEKRVLVTGGAGFVGSHLVDGLMRQGASVTVYDNTTTWAKLFLERVRELPNFRMVKGDLLTGERLDKELIGCDTVFHFAAIADIRHASERPALMLEQNLTATMMLLDGMRRQSVPHIVFASSGAVYGTQQNIPIPEDCPFPVQDSLYGATKLASEALISSYCHSFGMRSTIYRFTPMIGERYWHGHIFDWVKGLRRKPDEFALLGTGKERKFCLYVKDAVDGMLLGAEHSPHPVNIYNLGGEDFYTISDAFSWVARQLRVGPDVQFKGQTWPGDNPNLYLDNRRIKALGWRPTVFLRDAVERTVSYLLNHPQLLERPS